MTTKKIIAWLTLKELPEAPVFTKSMASIRSPNIVRFGLVDWLLFTSNYCMARPDFFLPIYEGEEVCPECRGKGQIHCPDSMRTITVTCPTCNGERKVTVAPPKDAKPECPKCGGSGKIFHYHSSATKLCPRCSGTGDMIPWPPVVGQRVYWMGAGVGVKYGTVVKVGPYSIDVYTDCLEVHFLHHCYPTRELAEAELAWRKEWGL